MRHIISILMANEAGALVRVAGMFSQRGFNIETLNVAPTEDETVSRLTLVTTGSAGVLEQINRQLLKLVDVIDVLDLTGDEHTEAELAFLKVHTGSDAERIAEQAGAQSRDERDGVATLQCQATGEQIGELVRAVAAADGLVAVARSGALAMTPGVHGLRYQQPE